MMLSSKAIFVSLLCIWVSFASNATEVTSGSYRYNIEDKEPWITTVDLPNVENVADQSIQYLLNDEQLNLTKGSYRYFVRNAQKVISGGGLEQASKISFSFQPSYQSISLHEILIHRNKKVHGTISAANIQLLRREEEISNNIYDGYVDLVIVIPDIRVGDIIEYSATIRGKNPALGQKNFAKFAAGWQVPVLNNHIRVLTDKNRPLKSKLHGVKGAISTSSANDFIEYVWSQEDVPPVIDEQDYPSLYSPYPYIEFSEYKDWAEVVSWAESLYSVTSHSSDELKDYVQNLKATTKSTQEYIEKSIQFVQNEIRYFGIEMGESSHKPSLPNVVFSRRFGDCKDKTVLLNYLLSEVGIEAYPALVSTYEGNAIINHLPSPGSFDHVITYFELDEIPYWIDGTRAFQFGELSNIGISNFQKALLIRESENKLVDVHLNDNYKSRIRVFEKFSATDGFDKPVNMELKIVLSSHEAEYIRSIVANKSLKEFSKNYVNLYGQYFPTINPLSDLQIEDDQKNNLLTISGRYEIPNYWDLSKPQIYTDFFGGFISSYVQLPATIKRELPLALYHPIDVEHTTSFLFPEEINWALDFNPLIIKDDAINYRRKITKNGKTLEVVHSYKSVNDTVQVEDVPDHIKNLKSIQDALYLSVYSVNRHKKSNIKSVLRSLLNKKKAAGE